LSENRRISKLFLLSSRAALAAETREQSRGEKKPETLEAKIKDLFFSLYFFREREREREVSDVEDCYSRTG